MSIKHRVKDRDASGKIRPLWRVGADEFSREYIKWGYVDYSKSPSAWNRIMNNRPKRKEARALCRGIVTGDKAAELAMFPLDKKPYTYFW